MATLNPNSPDKLCAEILAEAQREAEGIVQQAKAEAARLLAEAKAEAEKIRRERQAQAEAEARHRKELILATVAVETGRLRSARVEMLLESVHEEVRRDLRAGKFDGRETVSALATEAIRRMNGNAFVLKLSPADHRAFGDAVAGEIALRVGRSPLKLTIADDDTLAGGGVVVQDVGGFQVWDNRLLSRLERLWPELRRQVAVAAALVGDDNPAGGSV